MPKEMKKCLYLGSLESGSIANGTMSRAHLLTCCYEEDRKYASDASK